MIYLSDHGEALGEDNLWLHASDAEIMHHTAALVWMSDKYIENYPNKYNAILSNKQKKYKTSYIMKKFLPYYKKYIPTVILDLFCASLTTICEIILRQYFAKKPKRPSTIPPTITAPIIASYP